MYCINRYPYWSHIHTTHISFGNRHQSVKISSKFITVIWLLIWTNRDDAHSVIRINARMDNEKHDDDGDDDDGAYVASKMWWRMRQRCDDQTFHKVQTLQRCDSINCMTWQRIIGVHTQNLSMGAVLFWWLACKQFITECWVKHYSYRCIIRTKRWFVFFNLIYRPFVWMIDLVVLFISIFFYFCWTHSKYNSVEIYTHKEYSQQHSHLNTNENVFFLDFEYIIKLTEPQTLITYIYIY